MHTKTETFGNSKFQIQLEPVSLEFIDDDDTQITIVIYVDDIIIY